MTSPSTTRELDPVIEEMITLEDAKKLVENAERRGYVIRKPANPHNLRLIKQAVHAVIAERLTEARNSSGLNNDKINRLMLDNYMRRKRQGKAWTFTNAMSSKTIYLADAEEVDMLAKILKVEPEKIGIHLAIIPWALADQQARRDAKRQTPVRRRKNDQLPPRKAAPPERAEKDMQTQTTAPAPRPRQDSPPDHPAPVRAAPRRPTPPEPKSIPLHAGDLKITHSGDNVQVHGKVWCTLEVAQKLRMIVPLKLINQAKGDDPWCYEIGGPVHAYQLYNLMHVLYGAPRVTAVQMD